MRYLVIAANTAWALTLLYRMLAGHFTDNNIPIAGAMIVLACASAYYLIPNTNEAS